MAAQFYKLTNITKFAYNGQILWYAHFIQNFLYKKSEKCVCVCVCIWNSQTAHLIPNKYKRKPK